MTMKKSLSIILLATILLQSCVAYHRTSVSLHDARYLGKVKITTTSGAIVKYKNIEIQDSIYFGIRGKNVTPLDAGQIATIQLQDITKSKSQTGILVTVITVSILTIVGIILVSAFFAAIAAI